MLSAFIPMLCLTYDLLTQWPHTPGSSPALLFLSLKNSPWPLTAECQGTSPHMINDSSAPPQVLRLHFNLHKGGEVLLLIHRKWITHTVRGDKIWNVKHHVTVRSIRVMPAFTSVLLKVFKPTLIKSKHSQQYSLIAKKDAFIEKQKLHKK